MIGSVADFITTFCIRSDHILVVATAIRSRSATMKCGITCWTGAISHIGTAVTWVTSPQGDIHIPEIGTVFGFDIKDDRLWTRLGMR